MNRIVPPTAENIARAAAILRAGGLVAFPTETVYGLGANALDPAAVRNVFVAKERPDWDPLIVHVSGLAMARRLTIQELPSELTQRFWPGPLTLVVRKAACVPDEVTARRPTVALRMPRHPVAQALLAAAQCPIAAPSANRFGRPSPTRAEHVAADLGERVELILDGGPTELGVESTVLDLTQSPPVILRPGGVTREQLGGLRLAGGVAEEVAAKGLAGPGMTVRHYAPRAAVELFEDETAMQARAGQLRGRRVGVLVPTAENLYAEMRRLEAEGMEVILCLLPPPTGVGLAVRDRLCRAAGCGLAEEERSG